MKAATRGKGAKRNGKPEVTRVTSYGNSHVAGKGSMIPAALGPVDRFMALSDYEKEAIYRELDRPIPASATHPMTPAERRQWDKARRKAGRPRIGKGTAVVSVTIEKGLLAWADGYAKETGLSRARLVGIALESFRDNVRRYRLISDAYDKQKPGRNGRNGGRG